MLSAEWQKIFSDEKKRRKETIMGERNLGFNIAQKWDYENGFYLTSHVNRIAKLWLTMSFVSR
jgi:hypothetical protein